MSGGKPTEVRTWTAMIEDLILFISCRCDGVLFSISSSRCRSPPSSVCNPNGSHHHGKRSHALFRGPCSRTLPPKPNNQTDAG